MARGHSTGSKWEGGKEGEGARLGCQGLREASPRKQTRAQLRGKIWGFSHHAENEATEEALTQRDLSLFFWERMRGEFSVQEANPKPRSALSPEGQPSWPRPAAL